VGRASKPDKFGAYVAVLKEGIMSQANKVWFITGISRGFGKAIAEAVLAAGDVVIGATRDGKADWKSNSGKFHILPLDVTQREQIAFTVAAAHALYGRLDVVVNNAGFGLLGAVEEASPDETRDVFAVNFFGALNVTQAALPLFRRQGRGHIVNLSSIAGLAPVAGMGLYAASKSAIEAMSESLAQELEPLGIHVTVVAPGSFRTDFLSDASIRYTKTKIDDYAPTSGELIRRLRKIAGAQSGDPALAAKAILQAVDSAKPPLHLVLGPDALSRTRAKLDRMTKELNEWESVSLSTDFAKTK
jgi:NAD(P)-dependent dehydrogenase (short-subunit alcohol dehydrogenase family)